ncbi:hypothetical protein QBC46DRAFT_353871 [Diplogelasinospora grovesii]|uniref:Uncharacterized protein n=1 Tax=Diplogelasinospora grovesii TaxID=303347 RepID=A0AAN6NBH6_9PEZI|nr:hypothetical protein QBC46DRAFT_353871 [Diplogelasinospora grovesii]
MEGEEEKEKQKRAATKSEWSAQLEKTIRSDDRAVTSAIADSTSSSENEGDIQGPKEPVHHRERTTSVLPDLQPTGAAGVAGTDSEDRGAGTEKDGSKGDRRDDDDMQGPGQKQKQTQRESQGREEMRKRTKKKKGHDVGRMMGDETQTGRELDGSEEDEEDEDERKGEEGEEGPLASEGVDVIHFN